MSNRNPQGDAPEEATLPPTNSLTMRLEITNRPGMIGKVLSAIGDQGATVGAIDLVEIGSSKVIRDITLACGMRR